MDPAEILVVGIGGGGAKVIDLLAAGINDGPTFAVVDTDARALAESSVPVRVEAGSAVVRGLGTGGDVALGGRALGAEAGSLRELVSGRRLVIVLACLGGGTGSSGALLVAAAREAGAVTLCFATRPFEFEGPSRTAVADEAAARFAEAADILVLVPNDKLTGAAGGASVADAFARANEVLIAGVAATWKLVTKPGYINLGLADIRQAAGRAGVCGFAYAEGEGEQKRAQAVDALLASPMLDGGAALAKAECLLVSIVGGRDLTLQDVSEAMAAISARSSRDVSVAMGTVIDETWQDRLGILVLAADRKAVPAPAEAPRPGPGEAAAGKGRSGRRKRKPTHTQTKLSFDSNPRGRFKNVEPTILDGEDLDTPTFIRRGIQIRK